MAKFKFSVLVAIACVACTPALAASPVTDLFLANIKANIAFLDQAGKLAVGHSHSAMVLRFARTEIAESFRTAEMLDGVAPSSQFAQVAPDNDAVLTGRSAATVPPLGQAANGRSALGKGDVEALIVLKGKSFDDVLWQKQLDALSQLRADYETYAVSGDDAVLVALAKRELPRVEARLLALTKI